jgi:hypothetical protein
MKYEYFEYNKTKHIPLITMLNDFGQQGWQLVLVRGGNNYVFMRLVV